MVIDTSAVLAVLFDEPGAEAVEGAFENDPVRLISAATLLEAAIVVEARHGEPGGRELDLLLHRARVNTIPFDADQVDIAREAWRQYGKGRHPAGLNFGDCFALALAKQRGEPLLYVGDDFSRTGVASVL